MQKLTFGSDPEMMIFKDGMYYSAIGIVPGTIYRRFSSSGHEFYHDNVLAECAIKPASSKEEVVRNFRNCFQIYADLIRPYEIKVEASHDYTEDQLMHPDAKKVGCVSEDCAYELVVKEGPKEEIANNCLRSCGGHIHIGTEYLAEDGPEVWLTVYMLDLFLAVPSLWIDRDPTSARRRILYGHAGRYRQKDYGIEYRSLSNFWIQSPELVEFIYDISSFVIDFVSEGKAWDLWRFDEDVFFESDTPSDAWTCLAYDVSKLREGINQSDRSLVSNHFEIARDLIPGNIRNTLDSLCRNNRHSSFYENWEI